jgi:nitrate/TMAO reductase-like tetraheme cytochrome c subunit
MKEDQRLLPRHAYNWISAAGAVVALTALFIIVFLFAISLYLGVENPYLGILIYLVLPAFMVGGLLLIPAGMYAYWRIWQRTGELPYTKWPHLDLNIARHRNATFVFLSGTLAFVLVSGVGTYQAYHFTESIAFCGQTCHTVMKPEFTTYQHSPHARVTCAQCHVGPGAGWYAKSKLAGAYQVYAVAAGVFPRPIPTPITSLRPARETCEQCHWPQKFYGAMQRRFDHYRYDKENTRWTLDMLLKVGSGNPATAQESGIHWHINPAVTIDYIERDAKRQDIPWVRVRDGRTGRTTVYQDSAKPLTPAQAAAAKPRTMDCMDCHNRPSHNLYPPDYVIDLEMFAGRVDPSIPEIKRAAVAAMAKDYPTGKAALEGIAKEITEFYQKNYADLAAQKKDAIAKAVQAAQAAFARNIFPEMKAKWSSYPNDIGHFIFPGCWRCHGGKHKSSDGKVITQDCTACHIILSQGPGPQPEFVSSERGLPFQHPTNIGGMEKAIGCFNCHKGVKP